MLFFLDLSVATFFVRRRFLHVHGVMAVVLACSWQSLRAADFAATPNKPPSTLKYLPAKAYHILPETHNQESGYSSLCEGLNGKMYVGTAKYGENAYLVEFDPKTEEQRIVIDTNAACNLLPTGWNEAQSKIHTRNFVAPSGRIYVGTMGIPEGLAQRLGRTARHRLPGVNEVVDNSVYRGGYVMRYDPKTGKAENLGMPQRALPTWAENRGQAGLSIMDVAADEKRGLLYVAMDYWDESPNPWMLGTLHDGQEASYRAIGPMLCSFATTLIDRKGRANAITIDGKLAQYNPDTKKVTVRGISVGGKEPASLAGTYPTWCLAADGRTAYLIHMDDPTLYAIDLLSEGKFVAAKSHGKMIEGRNYDSRSALSIGPDGRVYAVVRIDNETGFGAGHLHHLVCFDPKTQKMTDFGIPAVKNPAFVYESGKPLPQYEDGIHPTIKGTPENPSYHGYHKLPDGTMTPLYHHHSLIVARDGTVYMTILYPFTLLKIDSAAYQH